MEAAFPACTMKEPPSLVKLGRLAPELPTNSVDLTQCVGDLKARLADIRIMHRLLHELF